MDSILSEKKELLIVDDDKNILELFQEAFSSTNKYTVYTAETFDQALHLIKRHEFKVVITDYRLQDTTGLDIINYINTFCEGCHPILITGFSTYQIKQETIHSGAVHYFEKPVNILSLINYVNGLFEDGSTFSGEMFDIGIIEIIQMLIISNATKVLELAIGEESINSKVYFRNGSIIHAESFTIIGEEAFKKILHSKSGTFKITNYSDEPEQTIFKNSNNLILNSMVQKDEVTHIETRKKNYYEIETSKRLNSFINENSSIDSIAIIAPYTESLIAFSNQKSFEKPENEYSIIESVLIYFKEYRVKRILLQMDSDEPHKPSEIFIKLLEKQLFLLHSRNKFYCVLCDNSFTADEFKTLILENDF